MTRPLSNDLRERIIGAVEGGMSCNAAAKVYDVAVSAVIKLVQRWKATGSFEAKPMGGYRGHKLSEHTELVQRLVKEKPDTLIRGLRQEHKYRHSRKDKSSDDEKRGHISDMLSIEERPKAVAKRTVPGHWEGDLIMGKNKKTAIGTLVERVTRYTMIVHLKAKDAQSVRKAYATALQKLPQALARTLTYDQGKEMSDHKRFTIDTGIKVYFAHPSSPWERGTNENTNGLIRQFFPKGTDFADVSPHEIRKVQSLLNDRPRKVLEYRTPNEVFNQLVALDP